MSFQLDSDLPLFSQLHYCQWSHRGLMIPPKSRTDYWDSETGSNWLLGFWNRKQLIIGFLIIWFLIIGFLKQEATDYWISDYLVSDYWDSETGSNWLLDFWLFGFWLLGFWNRKQLIIGFLKQVGTDHWVSDYWVSDYWVSETGSNWLLGFWNKNQHKLWLPNARNLHSSPVQLTFL